MKIGDRVKILPWEGMDAGFKNNSGVIVPKLEWNLYADRDNVFRVRLDRPVYGDTPTQYFYNYVLQLEEPELPEDV